MPSSNSPECFYCHTSGQIQRGCPLRAAVFRVFSQPLEIITLEAFQANNDNLLTSTKPRRIAPQNRNQQLQQENQTQQEPIDENLQVQFQLLQQQDEQGQRHLALESRMRRMERENTRLKQENQELKRRLQQDESGREN
ncbi:hypothetical protein MW887_002748 [Aspergillus wentii]|nr:hypothetical protein MW887_002748 [Aspergillus wentii]